MEIQRSQPETSISDGRELSLRCNRTVTLRALRAALGVALWTHVRAEGIYWGPIIVWFGKGVLAPVTGGEFGHNQLRSSSYKSNRLHVDILRFSVQKLGYIL